MAAGHAPMLAGHVPLYYTLNSPLGAARQQEHSFILFVPVAPLAFCIPRLLASL